MPPPDPAPDAVPPLRVGVFDSGVGGLSVLKDLREVLPGAQLLYVADSAWAPYGERSEAEILMRSEAISRFLRFQQVDVLVVACNTATAAAVHHLRAIWPDWPIVGVEPGLKPAAAATRNGRIGVLATEATLRSGKFQKLMADHGQDLQLTLQACPGLAAAIEAGDLDAPVVLALVERYCAPLRAQGVDTVVLGCTHYPFVVHHIAHALGPQVRIIDTSRAVAQRALALSEPFLAIRTAAPDGPARLWTTSEAAMLQAIATRWLPFPAQVRALDA
ncbi:MAG: glutamate racemase [Aquabacterium sp.]|nr:MAG: glutamate racemase [Aquabacterium sp.]